MTIDVTDKLAHGKAIDDMIRRVARTQESFNQRVQTAAIMIVAHAQAHGDCLRAVKLCRAVNAHQRNSLVGWFKHVSPINVIMGKTVKDDNARFFKDDSPHRNPFDMDKAKAIMWTEDPEGVNAAPKPLGEYADFWTGIEAYFGKVIKDADKTDDKAKFTDDARELIKNRAAELLKMLRVERAKELAALAASQSVNDTKSTDEDNVDAPSAVVNMPVGKAA